MIYGQSSFLDIFQLESHFLSCFCCLFSSLKGIEHDDSLPGRVIFVMTNLIDDVSQ